MKIFQRMPAVSIAAMFLLLSVTGSRGLLAQDVTPAVAPPPAMAEPVMEPTAPAAEMPTPALAEGASAGSVAENISGQGSVVPLNSERVTFESSTNAAGNELLNVAVDNETLENVVSMFTKLSGANIVATSANLTGTVTVNLKGVDWKAALAAILDLHDLALVEKTPGSDVYSIVPRPAPSAEPLVVESFFLKYTTVAEVKPIITSMLTASSNLTVTISEFPSRNAMIVKTTEPNMREIKKIIDEMDLPGKQVCVETKFMELTDSASKQIGIRWDSLEEFGLKLGAGPFTYNRNTSRDKSDVAQQSQWNKQTSVDANKRMYDKNGVQVEDTTPTWYGPPGSSNISDYIRFDKVVPTRTITDTSDIGNSTTKDVVNSFGRTITEQQSAILEMDSFNMVLSALKRTDGANVISSPKLIVASGSSNAYFSVGEREPIVRTEITRGTQDSPGDKIIANLDTSVQTDQIRGGYLETGISLQVVPVVKTDEMIEASIYPRLVRLVGEKSVGENSWPRLSVKEIKTTFTLCSGQTVAIGGLTDTSDDKQVTKIPLLGDIPIIGPRLFSHTSDAKRQVETIVFVTLSLAKPEELKKSSGIPNDAQLVHKRMLQDGKERMDFEKQMEDARKAAEAEQKAKLAEDAQKPKTSRKKR